MLKEYAFQMAYLVNIVPKKRMCYIYEEQGKDSSVARIWFNGCEYIYLCEECQSCETACWKRFRSSTL